MSDTEDADYTSDNSDTLTPDTPTLPTARSPVKRVRQQIFSRSHFTRLISEHNCAEDLIELYPRSLWHEGFTRSEYEREGKILKQYAGLQRHKRRKSYAVGDTFEEIAMTNFSVYASVNSPRFPGIFESLHIVASQCKSASASKFCLDGNILYDDKSPYVSSMLITDFSIGGLDPEIASSNESIWLQTIEGSQYCWYRLKAPAPEYASYWQDFLWLADLFKHLVDFLHHNKDKNIRLWDCHDRLMDYLSDQHSEHIEVMRWKQLVGGSRNIQKHIIRYQTFLKDQVTSLDEPSLLEHGLWTDIEVNSDSRDQDSLLHQTLLTPQIYTAFHRVCPHWGPSEFNIIREMTPIKSVAHEREKRRVKLGFSNDHADNTLPQNRSIRVQQIYKEGVTRQKPTNLLPQKLINQVILVRCGIKFNFALARQLMMNKVSVRVIWLVMPSETICGNKKHSAVYPLDNELFLTDRCNDHTINVRDVLGAYKVKLFTDDNNNLNNDHILVRYRYLEKDSAIVRACNAELDGCQDKTCKRLPRVLGRHYDHNQEHGQGDNIMNGGVGLGIDLIPKLANLAIFCGAGHFDRGIESCGLIQTKLSIDHNEKAIKSIRANKDPRSTAHTAIVSSSDIELEKLLLGKIPYLQFDTCTAGPPCVGFSFLNNVKDQKGSQKNCSLLASLLSWVDVLLPGYVIIENVPAMDDDLHCAQAICQLVAMGYQVRKFMLKASDFGACTKRKRLFIIAAAPVYELPQEPKPTHGSSLAKTVCIRQATVDLPKVHNDARINILYPDHIPLERYSLKFYDTGLVNIRDIVHRIPRDPPGKGLIDSYDYLSDSQKTWYHDFGRRQKGKTKSKSKVLRRQHPDHPFPAIVTTVSWQDARHAGETVHYEQDRCMTLEEARRAQGFPDDFLLVGTPADQLRQVGNAVPRALSEAISKVVGEAWRRTWIRRNASVANNRNSNVEDDHDGDSLMDDLEEKTITGHPIVIDLCSEDDDDGGDGDERMTTDSRHEGDGTIPNYNVEINSETRDQAKIKQEEELSRDKQPITRTVQARPKMPIIIELDSDSDDDII